MTARLRWIWYDLWVGAYWDRKARTLYLCPLPTVVIIVQFRAAEHDPGWWTETGSSRFPVDWSLQQARMDIERLEQKLATEKLRRSRP